MSQNDKKKGTRRDFLGQCTTAFGGLGIAATCWPFISSMNPSTDVLLKSTTEVDINPIPVGKQKVVAWQGKPVFIRHRSPDEIATVSQSLGNIDPEPDKNRVKKQEWLVVVGLCTHLGCVPNKQEAGWTCPCHGSVYDLSGRVIKGPAPRNLDIPPYQFSSDKKLLIGNA